MRLQCIDSSAHLVESYIYCPLSLRSPFFSAMSAPHALSSNPAATASHPGPGALDPTSNSHASQGRDSAPSAASPAELAHLKMSLRNGLRQFPDFPEPGILFEDIMPLFASHALHSKLIHALELQLVSSFSSKIDVIVGLDARGFLFGPTLALKIGAGFVPVRKRGKLPGACETEGFKKEYGEDFFQLQSDAIKPGQKVVVVDDIIATGMSDVVF